MDLGGRKWKEHAENCTVCSVMTCALQQILWGHKIRENNVVWACITHGS
jgi:hypothetical protein